MTLGGVLVEVETRFARLAYSRLVQLGDIVRLRTIDLSRNDVATAIERNIDHHATAALTGVGGYGQLARLTHRIGERVLDRNVACHLRVAPLSRLARGVLRTVLADGVGVVHALIEGVAVGAHTILNLFAIIAQIRACRSALSFGLAQV